MSQFEMNVFFLHWILYYETEYNVFHPTGKFNSLYTQTIHTIQFQFCLVTLIKHRYTKVLLISAKMCLWSVEILYHGVHIRTSSGPRVRSQMQITRCQKYLGQVSQDIFARWRRCVWPAVCLCYLFSAHEVLQRDLHAGECPVGRASQQTDQCVICTALINTKTFILNDFFTSQPLDFLLLMETWLMLFSELLPSSCL